MRRVPETRLRRDLAFGGFFGRNEPHWQAACRPCEYTFQKRSLSRPLPPIVWSVLLLLSMPFQTTEAIHDVYIPRTSQTL